MGQTVRTRVVQPMEFQKLSKIFRIDKSNQNFENFENHNVQIFNKKV